MTKKSLAKIGFAVFSLILFSGIGVSAQQTDCPTPDDAAIVKAVYRQIKAKYRDHLRHVNVGSINGVVTLRGWARTTRIKMAIENIVLKTKCVKSIVNRLGVGIRTGCGPGQKKCGDICIPSGETCNICTAKTCL